MANAYKEAGVDITAGYQAVKQISSHINSTTRREVLSTVGGFGGMFALPTNYRNPVLVAGTDGVGTKLKIAFAENNHQTIGIDLVAMCVNDIVVQGAEPLFFLDYIACDKLVPSRIEHIVSGIAAGCRQANCALIGGETAEMPGFYPNSEYDVAGFAVGVVERDKIIDGSKIGEGDLLIGLPSSGLHSNGFSLVRKLITDHQLDLNQDFADSTLGDTILTPTKIYVPIVLDLLKRFSLKGLAHITGGGMIENIPRILPEGLSAIIDPATWPTPAIFSYLESLGQLPASDMFNTFNMGIGLVIVVDEKTASPMLEFLSAHHEPAYVIGRVEKGSDPILIGGVFPCST